MDLPKDISKFIKNINIINYYIINIMLLNQAVLVPISPLDNQLFENLNNLGLFQTAPTDIGAASLDLQNLYSSREAFAAADEVFG